MNETDHHRNWRSSFTGLTRHTLSNYGAAWNTGSAAAAAPSRQQAAVTLRETGWFLSLSLLVALFFYANRILLLTEYNSWALVAYATDFVKAGATEKYVIRLLNTPNALFTLIYFYLKDGFPTINSYVLYKLILLACVVCNIYLLIRLSQYRSVYIVLLPVIFGYVLVGGMTHYYISLTLLFVLLLLYESKRNTPLATFLIVMLSYHSHFMGFFALMLLVLYKEGVIRTTLYSIIPFILLVSYKVQYHDAYQIDFNYSLLNHFLSVRRMLLPSMTDYHTTLPILLFSSGLNLLFGLFMAYLIVAGYFVPQDRRAYFLIIGLLVVYFMVPATLPGSGINIHERLIIPLLAIAMHVMEKKNFDRQPIVLLTAAVVANIWLCHYFFAIKGPDYRFPLLNKEPMDLAASAAEDILNGKHVDKITSDFFSSGIVAIKR